MWESNEIDLVGFALRRLALDRHRDSRTNPGSPHRLLLQESVSEIDEYYAIL